MNYEQPKKYWEERDPQNRNMPREKLIETIEKFLQAHNVMALATACGNMVRNTPVEYTYRNGAFYFLSEGGKKFNGLEVNKNVCLAVFDQMSKGICRGLQVTGIAQVIEDTDTEYTEYFKFRHLSPNAFANRVPYPIPLIKIEVKNFDYFDWELEKQNYSMRQHVEF